MADIQFVYFDLGGVLFNWKNALKNLALHLNRPYNDVFAVFKKYDDDVCRGKITPNHLWNYFQDELNVKVEIESFLLWWTNNFTPIRPMHALVKKISRTYKVGILTNIYSGTYEISVKKGLVPNILYETIIQSCELSLVKPDVRLFLHAQKRAKVPAANILFIDDSQKNLDTAKELGWHVELFDEHTPKESIKRIKATLKMN